MFLERFDPTRPRSVVAWAVVTGVVAGLVAAGYHSIVTEPLIDDAIAIEDARSAAAAAASSEDDTTADVDHVVELEQVSRSDQRGAGLFGGYALLGGAYALVLAVAALAMRGSWLDPFRRVLLAGSILVAALTVVPWLKYPPNPPAVGDPATSGERQRLYWLLVALTGLVIAGAAHLSGRLRSRGWPEARRIAAIAAATTLVLGVALAVMPATSDPIPAEVPANLMWRFRVASLGGNLLLWAVLSLGFGALWAERSRTVEAASRRQPTAGPLVP